MLLQGCIISLESASDLTELTLQHGGSICPVDLNLSLASSQLWENDAFMSVSHLVGLDSTQHARTVSKGFADCLLLTLFPAPPEDRFLTA